MESTGDKTPRVPIYLHHIPLEYVLIPILFHLGHTLSSSGFGLSKWRYGICMVQMMICPWRRRNPRSSVRLRGQLSNRLRGLHGHVD